jgi:hypothetical protein
MDYETINTNYAVNLFHDMLRPDSNIRILRLLGDGKMGKSHLMTKVFPTLAQNVYNARYAPIDLRNRMYDVLDILQSACSWMGQEKCKGYSTAYQAWIERSRDRSKVEMKGIRAIFSVFRISVNDNRNDIYYRNLELTSTFVSDIGKLADKPLLLLFDSVNNADESIQAWLMDTLLVHVSPFAHVRVFVAGRTLPEAHGSYAAICQTCQLRPVTEMEEYIQFCQKHDTKLVEQSIRDFAEACDYIPGAFTDLVVKFLK